jgi:hypothetical protein
MGARRSGGLIWGDGCYSVSPLSLLSDFFFFFLRTFSGMTRKLIYITFYDPLSLCIHTVEPFITPSIFDPLDGSIVDEYTFGQNQDRGAAEGRLRQHWESWITRDDFYQIRAAGLSESGLCD